MAESCFHLLTPYVPLSTEGIDQKLPKSLILGVSIYLKREIDNRAQAFVSALIVLICGYAGCFLGIAGCVMTSCAAATGCIVYAMKQHKQ